MDRGSLRAWMVLPAIAPIVVACLFSGLASAGDNVRVVPLCSDDRGDQAWVEIESAGDRTKATPYVAVGDERVRKVLENPDEKGTIAIPVPGLMRLVERARQALRGMKRPAADPPAAADAATVAAAPPATSLPEPREMGARPAMTFAPPEKMGAAIRPPAALYSASR